MAAGSGGSRFVGDCWRRGDPTESATENKPPREIELLCKKEFAFRFLISRGKGEKAGQEPTVPGGDTWKHGKPPAEQDQIRKEFPTGLRFGLDARRPVSSTGSIGSDFRVGRIDKWLPPPHFAEKTEFGLSAHSQSYLGYTEKLMSCERDLRSAAYGEY